MPFPNLPEKLTAPGLLTAADRVAGLSLPAHIALLTFQPGLLPRGNRWKGLFGRCVLRDEVAVLGDFGIGAPVVGVLTEDLAALGVERIIIVGMAGSLSPDLAPGDIVLCEKAVRDEGTSHHYLPAARYAGPSAALTARLAEALPEAHRGGTWTTDAPYRETQTEVETYRAEGVLTVEMEAAALFTVGQVRGIETAAVFVIGDSLVEERPFDARLVTRRLREVRDRLMEALR